MTQLNREAWLSQASTIIENTIIKPAIDALGIDLPPAKIAVSIGHPKNKRAIGECWRREASDDSATNQIFITPHNNDSTRILDVLTHELIHAYLNNEDGHRGRFALIARKVGLDGKLTATTAGPQLTQQLLDIIDVLGDIPHHALNEAQSGRRKQSTRMLKIHCVACDFTFRASRTQVARLAPDAVCPCCNTADAMTDSIIEALAQ